VQIAIGLFPGFTALDVMGPYQMLASVPGAEVVFCAERTGHVSDDHDLVHLRVDHTFADVARPDVLLVGGGVAALALATPDAAIVEWIRDAHPHTRWTTSVCTGSLLLGAAGLLDGLTATTHWQARELLALFGATPVDERVVVEGRIVTGAGVSAGIDMALTLVGHLTDEVTAQAIQLRTEYDPQPPYDTGAPWKATPEIRARVDELYLEPAPSAPTT